MDNPCFCSFRHDQISDVAAHAAVSTDRPPMEDPLREKSTDHHNLDRFRGAPTSSLSSPNILPLLTTALPSATTTAPPSLGEQTSNRTSCTPCCCDPSLVLRAALVGVLEPPTPPRCGANPRCPRRAQVVAKLLLLRPSSAIPIAAPPFTPAAGGAPSVPATAEPIRSFPVSLPSPPLLHTCEAARPHILTCCSSDKRQQKQQETIFKERGHEDVQQQQ